MQLIRRRHALEDRRCGYEAQSRFARERRTLLFGKHDARAEQHEKVAAALLDAADRAVQHKQKLDRADQRMLR